MASVSGNQPAAQPRPLVELLTTSDCPHCDAALALVQRVCWQLDGQAEVRVILVADQPAAERLRFLGSPTIRVNGRDIEPGSTTPLVCGDLCRVRTCSSSGRLAMKRAKPPER